MTDARRRFFAAALASLLAGAALGPRGATAAVTPTATAAATATSATVATAGAAAVAAVPVSDSAMLEETDALAGALGAVRRVPETIGFRRRLVDAAEAREAREAVVRLAGASGEPAVEQQMWERLGLLPAGAAPLAGAGQRALPADPAAGAPAGFYDPAARRLYVPSWIDLPAQRPTLAHEIAHALQDQRVGLRRFLMLAPDGRRGLDFDAQLAREAVMEGDASVLAMEALDPRGGFPAPLELVEIVRRMRAGAAETGGDRPAFLRELQAFPYVDGFAFVAGVRGMNAWPAVDALWKRPPESTAQILHPEKYERRDRPLAISALPLRWLAASGKLASVDTLGELVVRIWLSPVASPEVAERAAAGWRGDRVAVYLPSGAPPGDERPAALAWLTAWDSEADADDFLQIAGARLAALAAGREAGAPGPSAAPAPSAPDQPTVFESAGEPRAVFAIQRRSTSVALLLGAPADALPSLTVMLNSWPARGGAPAPGVRSPRGHREDGARERR